VHDKESGTQKNFAYVDFADTASQENAIQLHGQVLLINIIEIYEQISIFKFTFTNFFYIRYLDKMQ